MPYIEGGCTTYEEVQVLATQKVKPGRGGGIPCDEGGLCRILKGGVRHMRRYKSSPLKREPSLPNIQTGKPSLIISPVNHAMALAVS